MDSINCEGSVQNIQFPNRLNGVEQSGAKNAREILTDGAAMKKCFDRNSTLAPQTPGRGR